MAQMGGTYHMIEYVTVESKSHGDARDGENTSCDKAGNWLSSGAKSETIWPF